MRVGALLLIPSEVSSGRADGVKTGGVGVEHQAWAGGVVSLEIAVRAVQLAVSGLTW